MESETKEKREEEGRRLSVFLRPRFFLSLSCPPCFSVLCSSFYVLFLSFSRSLSRSHFPGGSAGS